MQRPGCSPRQEQRLGVGLAPASRRRLIPLSALYRPRWLCPPRHISPRCVQAIRRRCHLPLRFGVSFRRLPARRSRLLSWLVIMSQFFLGASMGKCCAFFFLVPQVPSLLAVSYLYPNAFSKSKAHPLVGADSHIHEMHKTWTFKASVSLLGDGQYPYFWQEEGGAQAYLFFFFV